MPKTSRLLMPEPKVPCDCGKPIDCEVTIRPGPTDCDVCLPVTCVTCPRSCMTDAGRDCDLGYDVGIYEGCTRHPDFIKLVEARAKAEQEIVRLHRVIERCPLCCADETPPLGALWEKLYADCPDNKELGQWLTDERNRLGRLVAEYEAINEDEDELKAFVEHIKQTLDIGKPAFGNDGMDNAMHDVAEKTKELVEERDMLRGAMQASDERLLNASKRVDMIPQGCDTPDAMADEILELRAERGRYERGLSDLQTQISGLQKECEGLPAVLTDAFRNSPEYLGLVAERDRLRKALEAAAHSLGAVGIHVPHEAAMDALNHTPETIRGA